MLDQDFNWGLEIAKRKKRWKAKEEELRTEAKNQKCPDSEENLSLEVSPEEEVPVPCQTVLGIPG